MTDQGKITANLPSRDFDKTEAFYQDLGFETVYRGEGWMILSRDSMMVEFFPHPDLNPSESYFSASMRLPDIDLMHGEWANLNLPSAQGNVPRLSAPFELGGEAPRMFALVDPDGSLWRVMEGTTNT